MVMLTRSCDILAGMWEQVMVHGYANPGQANFASAQGTCNKLFTTSKERQGAQQYHAPYFQTVRQNSDHSADWPALMEKFMVGSALHGPAESYHSTTLATVRTNSQFLSCERSLGDPLILAASQSIRNNCRVQQATAEAWSPTIEGTRPPFQQRYW